MARPGKASNGTVVESNAVRVVRFCWTMPTPDNLIPAYQRAIRATEAGQAALVEVLIKPMRTPELPDDWAV